jgi:hypothetical protein
MIRGLGCRGGRMNTLKFQSGEMLSMLKIARSQEWFQEGHVNMAICTCSSYLEGWEETVSLTINF